MPTVDDIQVGFQISAMDADGLLCTLTADAEGVQPKNVRTNQQNGLRCRPLPGKADAIVTRNGNVYELLHHISLDSVKALATLAAGETELYSVGTNPYSIRLSDSVILIGDVATLTRSNKNTHLAGTLNVDEHGIFVGDVKRRRDLSPPSPLVGAGAPGISTVVVTGSVRMFKVAVTVTNNAPIGTPLAVVTLNPVYGSGALALVGLESNKFKFSWTCTLAVLTITAAEQFTPDTYNFVVYTGGES